MNSLDPPQIQIMTIIAWKKFLHMIYFQGSPYISVLPLRGGFQEFWGGGGGVDFFLINHEVMRKPCKI